MQLYPSQQKRSVSKPMFCFIITSCFSIHCVNTKPHQDVYLIEWWIVIFVGWHCMGWMRLYTQHNTILLTHWGRDKIAAISQTTLLNAFSWIKLSEFWLKFHQVGPKGSINNISSLVQIKAWRRLGHYLNQWWLYYRRIHVYAFLGLNELSK